MWVWLVVPAVFTVYILTLSPTVGLIDSGELAAGCYLLNILHPTGYPLYTMLGRLATLVPVAGVVNRVAALSALLAAAGWGLGPVFIELATESLPSHHHAGEAVRTPEKRMRAADYARGHAIRPRGRLH